MKFLSMSLKFLLPTQRPFIRLTFAGPGLRSGHQIGAKKIMMAFERTRKHLRYHITKITPQINEKSQNNNLGTTTAN